MCILFFREAGQNCKCLEFSPDGSRAAWYNGTALKIYDVMKDRILHTIECAPLTYLQFSTKSTILATWQVYSSGMFHSSTRRNFRSHNNYSALQIACPLIPLVLISHDEAIFRLNCSSISAFHIKWNAQATKDCTDVKVTMLPLTLFALTIQSSRMRPSSFPLLKLLQIQTGIYKVKTAVTKPLL